MGGKKPYGTIQGHIFCGGFLRGWMITLNCAVFNNVITLSFDLPIYKTLRNVCSVVITTEQNPTCRHYSVIVIPLNFHQHCCDHMCILIANRNRIIRSNFGKLRAIRFGHMFFLLDRF